MEEEEEVKEEEEVEEEEEEVEEEVEVEERRWTWVEKPGGVGADASHINKTVLNHNMNTFQSLL